MSEGTELQLITLDQTTARDVIGKLRREIERIESPAEHEFSGDHVVNAFRTAWHLHAWIWDAVKEQSELKATVFKYRGIDEEGIEDEHAFGAALARRFVPLKICRIIATSPKHVQVVLPIGAMQDLSTPDPEQWTPMVMIMGRPVVATRLLEEIDDYWFTLIDECGLSDTDNHK